MGPLPARLLVLRAYGNILYATRKWGDWGGQPPRPLETSHLDAWMAQAADHGVEAVLWRANCAGTLTYPSRLAALTGEPPLPDPNRGMGIAVVPQGWLGEDWAFLGDQCRRFHTLEAAAAAAHRHGLQLYLDFATFDMVGSWCTRQEWPAGGDRAFDPDLWLWSRDQGQRLAGIPCYADPRVLRLRLAELDEALACGLDGAVLGFFSHVDGMAGEQPCAFGYNPPVVEEYQARWGTDPRQEVDPHRFYALQGEHFTAFVRQASQLVRRRGGRFLATMRTDGIHGWGGQRAGGSILGTMGADDLRGGGPVPLAGGFYLEWERWAREGLVDGLLCWAPWEGGVEAAQACRARAGVPLYLFRRFLGGDGQVRSPHSLEGYRRELAAVREGRLDGYCLHTTVVEDYPRGDPSWREVYLPG